MMFDYETLKIIWWVFIGLLLIGFVLTAGFDLGAAMLLPFIGKSDEQRRVIINSLGATWEGNQVWLILGAGAVFAAWPLVYAAAFSGLYAAMMLALFALVIRPGGFTYRSKLTDVRWRQTWDWALFAGGLVPAFVFGVAFGNLLQGVPFHYDDTLRSFYTGALWQLLNPFAVLAGVVGVTMLVMHGGIYLQLRTQGEIQGRSRSAVRLFGVLFVMAFALAGLWTAFGIEGYRITSPVDPGAVLTPLRKTVTRIPGGWLDNYSTYPWMIFAPLAGLVGAITALFLSRAGRTGAAFCASSVCLAGTILTAGFSMFPFMLPSSSHPDHSLTVWDGASSQLTLNWMFWATVIFLPIIIAYTTWVFRVLRGKVTVEDIRRDEHSAY
jgi:cytochrome bd ubiquinol oxidase subunit II